MYFLYSLALTIGFLLLLPRFIFHALTKGKYAAGFWQRLGYLPDFDREGKKLIWLHCVSVGETNASKPLVKEILANFPDCKLVVSTTTKTGQNLAQEIFQKQAALIFYFPFDWRVIVRRVLRRIKPEAVLIMETELWFNFLREAKNQNVKIALVNGRLSDKSFRNYKLIRSFMKKVLANLDLALMSGEADAQRMIDLGCDERKVFVTGNVKFDLQSSETENDLTRMFRERFGENFIVAASTHEPEEKWILAAFEKLSQKFVDARLLIVPRHPERFERVAELLEKSGLSFARRSAPTSAADVGASVILLDSIGELRSVYPLAQIVFVGGSLIPHGGQNILEPAAAQKAIVTGFYTMNFASIVKKFVAEDAVVQLPDLEQDQIADALVNVFSELLSDEAKREILAANALAVLLANAGATARTVEKLKNLLGKISIWELKLRVDK